MGWFSRFLSPTPNLFEHVPGPTPWYATDGAEIVRGVKWRALNDPEAVGQFALETERGPVAVLDMQCYVMALDERAVLVWHQPYTPQGNSEPVVCEVLRPHDMPILPPDRRVSTKRPGAVRGYVVYDGAPTARVELPTNQSLELKGLTLPPELTRLDELLLWCNSTALEPAAPSGSNRALMVIEPKKRTLRLHGQDWFNFGAYDFGYQWLARVARDPRTRHVRGEGVRLEPFTLDPSLRQLA